MSDFIEYITGGFASDLLQAVIFGVSSVISALLDFMYQLIFIDLKTSCITFGNNILNFFCDNFFTQPFTLSSLAYAFGFVFIIFIVNKAVSIIRG